jgi:glycerol-3-phosphate dehydrogenase (NAD(P)+)
MRIAVAGTTTWGLTLAWLLARDGREVVVIARDDAEARDVDARRGLARLPELQLPSAISVAAPDKLGNVDAVVVAVPARAVRQFVGALPIPRDRPILTGTKGIEHGSGSRVSDILADLGWTDVSVLSGPNLAREIVKGLPAAAVIASERDESAAFWQELAAGPVFRTYRSTDVIGVEICGAYKNVVAIAAGASTGLGFGANSLAGIMTRGLAEMTRLGVAMGAQQATFIGLAGVGDLAATCFSPLSRNHHLGALLAKGRPPQEALAEVGEVVEGAATAPVVIEIARRHGVEVPIAEQVAAVMEGRATVLQAMQALLSRSLKSEGA